MSMGLLRLSDPPCIARRKAVASGSERLSAALKSHPPYLRKALLAPKLGILDPILRILPSAHYSVPKSHNELLDDVKGSINPLLREMQAIIYDQDILIQQLLAALPTARHSHSLIRSLDYYFDLAYPACPVQGRCIVAFAVLRELLTRPMGRA
ncbi:hypothetical protein DFJ73DRAFT_774366 [Zopfochytrium polystomum]|nr:hypothetical protein DFJ73DRAFT_774366 [Zopfochytrium polystomum]